MKNLSEEQQKGCINMALNIKRTDCHAFRGDKKCPATTYENCEECPFYKSKIQNEAESARAKARAIEKGYYAYGDKYEPKGVM